MHRVLRANIVVLLVGLVIAGVALAALMVTPVSAHGSTQRPASRVYTCRFENQNNPMCAAAWSANSQALYDWMEVNIGDAGGRHQDLIPDGQLCSAGRGKYGAFDQPGEWPVTALTTDGSGRVDLVYENTAPHSTAYYRVYITNAGFDARTDGLGWGDLELVYDSGPLDRASVQTMRAPLPDRSTPAVLYIVWQRSDSPEAFYACSDVTVNAGSVTPAPTTTAAPAPSTTATTRPPITEPTTSEPSSTRPPTSEPTSTEPPDTQPTNTESPGTKPPVTQPPDSPVTSSVQNPSPPRTSKPVSSSIVASDPTTQTTEAETAAGAETSETKPAAAETADGSGTSTAPT